MRAGIVLESRECQASVCQSNVPGVLQSCYSRLEIDKDLLVDSTSDLPHCCKLNENGKAIPVSAHTSNRAHTHTREKVYNSTNRVLYFHQENGRNRYHDFT